MTVRPGTVQAMGGLSIEAAPEEVGFDAGRLARIDRAFARWVDGGRLPGWLIAVSRHGRVVHLSSYGQRDVEAGLPVEVDTQWRIYSMTKPVTSVAAMILYEEGAFELTDPISRFLPAFEDMRVYVGGSTLAPVTEPARGPIKVWHLLTHTSGLTYPFHRNHPVDERLRTAGYDWGYPEGKDLAGCCDDWAAEPLLFEPGTEWNYSVSTDVLGRLVEVVSGQSLDEFCRTRIFEPLGMTDTTFGVADQDRLAAMYTYAGRQGYVRDDAMGALGRVDARVLSGGGGLISTAADYHRFTQMLRRGGELDGVRLLGSRTVRMMTRNQLPHNADLESFGRPLYAETPFRGVGFGLGFAVVLDPCADGSVTSPGEYAWGGAASTAFFVDPAEDITALFFTQLLPPSVLPTRSRLRQLIYQALVD